MIALRYEGQTIHHRESGSFMVAGETIKLKSKMKEHSFVTMEGNLIMPNEIENNSSLAVLIDADNANPSIIEGLLAEVAKLGVASVKRIYGDWTLPNLGSWKSVLLEHSIQPMQQFRYTTGKNATDSAMIIDAMDLLYTGHFSGFCLVSSDSDFTRLASRIRESGLRVYGFGERKTPRPFVSACDRFIYTEVLIERESDSTQTALKPKSQKELRNDKELLNLFKNALEAASDDEGLAQLGTVGNHIIKMAKDFDPRNYGYAKLSGLAKAIGLYKIEHKDKSVYIQAHHQKIGS